MRERAELLPAFTVRDRRKFAGEKKREVIGTAGKIVSVVVFSWRRSLPSSVLSGVPSSRLIFEVILFLESGKAKQASAQVPTRQTKVRATRGVGALACRVEALLDTVRRKKLHTGSPLW
jgi:hypothetical protein